MGCGCSQRRNNGIWNRGIGLKTHYLKIWHPDWQLAATILKVFRVDLRKVMTLKGSPTPSVLEFTLPVVAYLNAFGAEVEVVKINAEEA